MELRLTLHGVLLVSCCYKSAVEVKSRMHVCRFQRLFVYFRSLKYRKPRMENISPTSPASTSCVSETKNIDSQISSGENSPEACKKLQKLEDPSLYDLTESNTDPSLVQEKAKKIIQQRRLWWFTEYGTKHQKRHQNGLDFTVMTYNILSQKLLEDHQYLYSHCNPKHLAWSYRVHNLLQEISACNPDILCLQELEEEQYQEIFKSYLQKIGYAGLYKKKTREKCDGCAIFIKEDTFILEAHTCVEFLKNSIKILNRDNVGIVALLRPKSKTDSQAKLCVATTHLLYNPRRGDIKLSQLRILLAEIERLSLKSCTNDVNMHYPIVLCGDMNSEPFSPLYDFIVSGKINYTNMMSGDISGQKKGYEGKGQLVNSDVLSLSIIGIHADTKYGAESICCASSNIGEELSINQSSVEDKVSKNDSSLPELDNNSLVCLSTKSDTHDYRQTPLSNVFETATGNRECDTGVFSHHFNLVSTYKHLTHDGDQEITTQNQGSKCTVDYIFYSVKNKESFKISGKYHHKNIVEGDLKHLGCYGLLHSSDFRSIGGLPNAYISSDHLCLISRFLLTV